MPKQKKQSKLSKTINWLKPTSAKKGALLFAIAFAVIGGSVFAYKSFASSWAVWPQYFTNTYRGVITNITYIENGTKLKKTVPAMNLAPYGGTTATIYVPSGGVKNKICVNTINSDGGNLHFDIYLDALTGPKLATADWGSLWPNMNICQFINIPTGSHNIVVKVRNNSTSKYIYVPSVNMYY